MELGASEPLPSPLSTVRSISFLVLTWILMSGLFKPKANLLGAGGGGSASGCHNHTVADTLDIRELGRGKSPVE